MDDDAALFTIGRLARRTGLPVRTIRYWSDIGAVPPAGRTGVVEHTGAARDRGVAPESAEGAEVLDRILVSPRGGQRRADLLAQLEAGTDPRAERYWQLLGVINGWPPFPAHVPAFEWMIAALRAHG